MERSIEILLGTIPRERVMQPLLGAGLAALVFAPNVPSTWGHVEQAVREVLRSYEPRIDVERVEASASELEPSVLEVSIDYVVRRSNTFFNRVFPFHLREGG